MPDVLVWNVIKTHIIWNVLVVHQKNMSPLLLEKHMSISYWYLSDSVLCYKVAILSKHFSIIPKPKEIDSWLSKWHWIESSHHFEQKKDLISGNIVSENKGLTRSIGNDNS